ncbi:hypothetical protein TcWFU_008726 [Taenia crassiceps]|uniref:Uncharacterized protein n=1 Tax=Taenia crassiceps TaxID=6207 RepID=A0ABR4PZ97_9CEST
MPEVDVLRRRQGDEVELLEAEVIDPEDEVKFLAETRVNEGEPSASDSRNGAKHQRVATAQGLVSLPSPKSSKGLPLSESAGKITTATYADLHSGAGRGAISRSGSTQPNELSLTDCAFVSYVLRSIPRAIVSVTQKREGVTCPPPRVDAIPGGSF